ncbi:ribosomal protein L7/L12, putative [Eimeria tenella]|uniref:Ribosomal protein L7/L12, putative n=1 Tax=Eimeria tenella TaxID=5802 RepID=U6KIZ1_EIMTE|nr:ribosomal protein L7/L12, putative [Eimeria tenella]CDJ37995.1 ribosomal protein L7/L12, putative [Eimeria tenella]|eukprot:XP_013228833.1 ribosomal protein L7/L12, putative [Eimeria tenella]
MFRGASRCAQQRLLLLPQQDLLLQRQQQQQRMQQHLLQQQAAFSSSYDIFKKLQDPPSGGESTQLARKPSEKVLRLVDEVMNLTLIEAADLCDLCQEKLAQRGGGPAFNAAVAAGRSPFPHPSSLFAGQLAAGGFGFAAGGTMPAAAAPPPPAAAAAAEAAPAAGGSAAAAPPEGVPIAEAEALKAKLEAAGAQVALE